MTKIEPNLHSEKGIREKILRLMTNHIGRNNGITREQLFIKCLGNRNKYNEFQALYFWTMLKRSLNQLRKKTACFVASHRIDGGWEYFVLKTQADANIYKACLSKNISAMNRMAKRADELVSKQAWRDYKGEYSA